MHNKTYMAAIGWLVSVGGWWVWSLALSGGVPPESTKNDLPYPIKYNLVHGYGADFQWWLAITITLSSFLVFELAVSSIRKTWWPTDADTFQVLQKDPAIRLRLEDAARGWAGAKGSETASAVLMGGRGTRSTDAVREGEIQELLDRPRVMGGSGEAETEVGVVESDVSPDVAKSPSGYLVRRKISVDGRRSEQIEMRTPRSGVLLPKTRHSVDIAELLGRQ